MGIDKQNEKIIEYNTKFKDGSSKLFFKNAILCAQFLKDYVEIPILKNIKPEDIEDVTERYTPLFTSEREADTVKRINLGDGTSLFLISLIEHKTKVDYNVIMQLLRYMCYIWEDYEKEMQKESDRQKKESEEAGEVQKKVLTSIHKDFKYPPILPIVYFEGTGTWTAVMNLKDRIYLADIFDKYIPDFTYEVICPHDYTDQQLMEKNNEMGLIMLLNKLQSLEDFKGISVWKDSQENILKESPQYILDIIARFMTILLNRLNLPQEEIEDFVSRIKEGNMPELFENFERVDVPKMREEIARQQEEIDKQKEILDKQQEEMDKQQEELDKQQEEMDKQQEEMDKQQEELDKRQEEMDQTKEYLNREIEGLGKKHTDLDKEREEIDSLRKMLEEQQRKLLEEWSRIEEVKKKA